MGPTSDLLDAAGAKERASAFTIGGTIPQPAARIMFIYCHRKGNRTPTFSYAALLSLHCPCQYFITFHYLSKSTSSSFPCINRILNLIIITTVTSHQGLCFVIIHTAEHSRHYRSTNCCDSSELLPRTSLPPINATQLRDHAITSSVTSEPNLLTLILISVH